jgi:uncharacterized protein involved in outer membrane biogenesis
MKRRRFCWLGVAIPLAVLLSPLLLWVLIVMVAPTSWARAHVVSALERSSGRAVHLDDLGVCLGGGIELTNLKIGAPQSIGDPWLQAKKIQIDVSLIQLLFGKFEPTYLEIEEATLRVLRRKDGSLELADLVRPSAERSSTSSKDEKSCGPHNLTAKVRGTRILLLDEPTQTRLQFEEVEGDGVWKGEGVLLSTLNGKLNDGPFQFTAHLARQGGEPSFEGQIRAKDVALDQGMSVLRYVVPVLAGATGRMQGRLGMDVYLRGRGKSRETLGRSLVGHGNVSLDPVELDGSPLMAEIGRVANLPAQGKVGSIRSDFVVKDGRVNSDRLTITAGRVPLVAGGWTNFDGQIDYLIKLEGVSDRMSEKARKFINGLDLDFESLTSVRLSGSVDRVNIKLNAAGGDVRSTLDQIIPREDQDRLKVLGRKLREKVLR